MSAMKKTISCMLFLLLAANSWAEEYIDVVYLKNVMKDKTTEVLDQKAARFMAATSELG